MNNFSTKSQLRNSIQVENMKRRFKSSEKVRPSDTVRKFLIFEITVNC